MTVHSLGYGNQADVLRSRVAAAVAQEGRREYYDPYTAHGMGATDFAWPTLMLDMLEPDPGAAWSYLA